MINPGHFDGSNASFPAGNLGAVIPLQPGFSLPQPLPLNYTIAPHTELPATTPEKDYHVLRSVDGNLLTTDTEYVLTLISRNHLKVIERYVATCLRNRDKARGKMRKNYHVQKPRDIHDDDPIIVTLFGRIDQNTAKVIDKCAYTIKYEPRIIVENNCIKIESKT